MTSPNRWGDVMLGAFVLSALAMLMVGSLWIMGSDLFSGRMAEYRIRMLDSGGVTSGDRVRFAGMEIGRVQGMTLQPERDWPVLLSVRVQKDLPLKVDSTAVISSSGLLGSSYLQIRPGSATAQRLPEGGEIRGHAGLLDETLAHVDQISEKVLVLLDQVSGTVDQVSGEIDPMMRKFERLLSDRNVENIEVVLASLRSTMEESGPKIDSMMARLETVAIRMEEGMDEVPEISGKISGLLDDVRSSLGPDGERVTRVLEQAEASLVSADDALSVVGSSRRELEWTLSDLRDTVSNLKSFSQTMKERPYSLVRIRHPEERRPGDGAPVEKP